MEHYNLCFLLWIKYYTANNSHMFSRIRRTYDRRVKFTAISIRHHHSSDRDAWIAISANRCTHANLYWAVCCRYVEWMNECVCSYVIARDADWNEKCHSRLHEYECSSSNVHCLSNIRWTSRSHENTVRRIIWPNVLHGSPTTFAIFTSVSTLPCTIWLCGGKEISIFIHVD